ncbi:hypothetical protein [Rosettibacter firmus]|uniref:hypothetical protein n=1 Tax=Rosettibacter firmus TaxID=3111522 RepID=UPI00336C13DF
MKLLNKIWHANSNFIYDVFMQLQNYRERLFWWIVGWAVHWDFRFPLIPPEE